MGEWVEFATHAPNSMLRFRIRESLLARTLFLEFKRSPIYIVSWMGFILWTKILRLFQFHNVKIAQLFADTHTHAVVAIRAPFLRSQKVSRIILRIVYIVCERSLLFWSHLTHFSSAFFARYRNSRNRKSRIINKNPFVIKCGVLLNVHLRGSCCYAIDCIFSSSKIKSISIFNGSVIYRFRSLACLNGVDVGPDKCLSNVIQSNARAVDGPHLSSFFHFLFFPLIFWWIMTDISFTQKVFDKYERRN